MLTWASSVLSWPYPIELNRTHKLGIDVGYDRGVSYDGGADACVENKMEGVRFVYPGRQDDQVRVQLKGNACALPFLYKMKAKNLILSL